MANKMMMKPRGSAWGLFGFVFLALIASSANAITCQVAVTKILPCRAFLVGNSDISPSCCQAAQSLVKSASSKEDRKAICECFKKVGPSIGVKVDRAKQLPELCHINVAFEPDPDVDCNKF